MLTLTCTVVPMVKTHDGPERQHHHDASFGVIAILDEIERLEGAAELRELTYERLGVGPGDTVVDVGCGTGWAAGELAARGVTTIGVDTNDEAIAVARRRHARCEFHTAPAERLPWADGTLQGYRAARLYHLVDEPSAAVAEAHRVLAPGGRMVIAAQDHDMTAVDAADVELTSAILRARSAAMKHPTVARRFRALLLDAGFADVTVDVWTGVYTDHHLLRPVLQRAAQGAVAAGAVTSEQASRWIEDQRLRGERDRTFVAVPMVVAAGVKARA
jgi:ubiquinone/menaquinone biosynthesis C-methylase UbiE